MVWSKVKVTTFLAVIQQFMSHTQMSNMIKMIEACRAMWSLWQRNLTVTGGRQKLHRPNHSIHLHYLLRQTPLLFNFYSVYLFHVYVSNTTGLGIFPNTSCNMQ